MITSIAFDGKLGAGKSVSAVLCAICAAKAGQAITGKVVPIFTNINLKLDESIRLKSASDWSLIPKYREQSGSVILLDETQSLLDSRLSGSKGNIRLTQFFAYLRKMRSVLIMTTPAWNMVDLRVRLMLTYRIHVSRVGNKIVWDIFNPTDDTLIRTKVLPDIYTEFFKYYDSYDFVLPIDIPDNLFDFLTEIA